MGNELARPSYTDNFTGINTVLLFLACNHINLMPLEFFVFHLLHFPFLVAKKSLLRDKTNSLLQDNLMKQVYDR